jgi:hypothetical protein
MYLECAYRYISGTYRYMNLSIIMRNFTMLRTKFLIEGAGKNERG